MEDDIGTPVEPEPTEPEPAPEPTTVVVSDITDPEPVATHPLADRCLGVKANGARCGAFAKKGKQFCNKHEPNVQAAVVVEDKPKSNGKLKPYPFHDGGVNENSAIRVIRMVIPQCPVDALPEIKNRDGSWTPNPNFTGQQNCQQVYKLNNMGVWDVAKCEELGHDPWHTTFRRPVLEEVLDSDGYVIEQRTRYQVEKRLNIIQVSLNIRHSNGMEVALAKAKGCKELEFFGIASPCEFRNCSQPQRIETRVGKYCSERHARLVAADARGLFLPATGGGDPYTADRMAQEREEMLETLNIRRGG